jgi:hypothetical protein
VVVFIQRQQRKLREFVYAFESDSFQSPDLTILSNQVSKGGITEIAYQQEPSTVVWGVKADGQLVGMTYLRDQQVVAWHRHKIGGVSGACTITVSDYANIAAGTTLTFTKSDGEEVTFTSTTGTAGTGEFRTQTNNNTTADNIYTAINAHADFTVANPAAAVVTVEETTPYGARPLTVTSSDTTRLTTTDQAIAVVESLAVIPSSTSGEEEVWMIVQRTINGVTRRYVEYLSDQFDPEENQTKADAFFVDSGLSYSGTAAASITGLGHLEGQAVSILGNGSVYTKRNVSSGAISSIDPTVTKAQIGLANECIMKTLRPEAGGDDGTSQGKAKRDFEVTLRLIDTLGGKIGPDISTADEIIFRTGSDPMDSSPPLFTGDKRINIRGGWDTAGQTVYLNDEPLPAHITALITRIITHDG